MPFWANSRRISLILLGKKRYTLCGKICTQVTGYENISALSPGPLFRPIMRGIWPPYWLGESKQGESEIANFKRSADLWLQRWRFLRHRRGTSTVRNLFCSWTRVRQKSLWRTRPAHFLKSPPMETCSDLAAVHHWFNQTLFIEHLSYMTCSARCFPKSNIRQHLRLEIPTQRDLCGKFY